jgi:NADH dehydrogenase/NADH:ubiquinone oxidoreductase subunit G
VGALTLKSFPYESRGWEVTNFDGVDFTDSYGSEIQVYITRRRILLIEPGYEFFTTNNWLSDKGRHIFDSLYKTQGEPENLNQNISASLYQKIIKKCYFLEHFFNSLLSKNILTIVFGQVGIETLSLINILTQRYSFSNLKSVASSTDRSTDFETTFQLNALSNYQKLKSSDLCLLIGTNSRFESFRINLMLRQRVLKGGFSCILFSSLIDLTFMTLFKNPNVNTIHFMSEGTHAFCQELTEAKNPLIIYNNELFKNNFGESILEALQFLSNVSTYGFEQNRLNMLNSTLCEAGGYTLAKMKKFSFKDLVSSSMFYFVHSNIACDQCIVQASEMNMLNAYLQKKRSKVVVIDQNYAYENNSRFSLSNDFYYYLPARTFYENEETYCNTEGVFKRTTKLFVSKNIMSTWQTFLLMLKYLNKHIQPLNFKSCNTLSYLIKGYSNFKIFMHLHFYSTQHLSSVNFYLTFKTTPAVLVNFSKFKQPSVKVKYSKLKFWLEDFFTGGRDEYSRNSEVLVSCSAILRTEALNF